MAVWFNVVIRSFENKQRLLPHGKAASFIPGKKISVSFTGGLWSLFPYPGGISSDWN
jgi:hypothetical protein